mgnify:CR=1 FL=1
MARRRKGGIRDHLMEIRIRYRDEEYNIFVKTTKEIADGLLFEPLGSSFFGECFARITPVIKFSLEEDKEARARCHIDVRDLVYRPYLTAIWELTGQIDLVTHREQRRWRYLRTIKTTPKVRKKPDPAQGKLCHMNENW